MRRGAGNALRLLRAASSRSAATSAKTTCSVQQRENRVHGCWQQQRRRPPPAAPLPPTPQLPAVCCVLPATSCTVVRATELSAAASLAKRHIAAAAAAATAACWSHGQCGLRRARCPVCLQWRAACAWLLVLHAASAAPSLWNWVLPAARWRSTMRAARTRVGGASHVAAGAVRRRLAMGRTGMPCIHAVRAAALPAWRCGACAHPVCPACRQGGGRAARLARSSSPVFL